MPGPARCTGSASAARSSSRLPASAADLGLGARVSVGHQRPVGGGVERALDPAVHHQHVEVVGEGHRVDGERGAVDAEGVADDPAALASWSMIPQGTPVAACSTRRLSWASSSAVPSNPSARARALVRAAEDDSPEPTGRSVETVPTNPCCGRSSPTTAATSRAHGGSSVVGSVGHERDDGLRGLSDQRRAQPHLVAARHPLDHRPEVAGHRQDASARVVGVIAHQVHPARGGGHHGRVDGHGRARYPSGSWARPVSLTVRSRPVRMAR